MSVKQIGDFTLAILTILISAGTIIATVDFVKNWENLTTLNRCILFGIITLWLPTIYIFWWF